MEEITTPTRNIRIKNPYFYAFLAALLTACCCIFAFFSLSVLDSFFPVAYTQEKNIDRYYNENTRYIHCTASKLYYTGYDYLSHSRIQGHYYYTLVNNQCTIYLIAKPYVSDPQNPPMVLENVRFNAVLQKDDSIRKPLLDYMAADLGWNYTGLERHCSKIIISQYHYDIHLYLILSLFCFLSIAATLLLGITAWRHRAVRQNHKQQHGKAEN